MLFSFTRSHHSSTDIGASSYFIALIHTPLARMFGKLAEELERILFMNTLTAAPVTGTINFHRNNSHKISGTEYQFISIKSGTSQFDLSSNSSVKED